MNTGRLLSIAATLALLALAACGRNEAGLLAEAVAARVNGGEISMRQVSASMVPGGGAAEQAGPAAARALERIIDEELLLQRAVRAGLDRDPQVIQALETARRRALAQAYLESAAQNALARTRHEAGKFYRENPALFERRCIYRLNELLVAVPPEWLEDLRQATARAAHLDEIEEWLRERRLTYQARSSFKAAEEIAMEMLPRLMAMQKGQIVVLAGTPETSVLQLAHSEPAPVSEEQARPLIERYLVNRSRLEVLQSEVRALRAQASIEYVGPFAPGKAQWK